MSYKQPQVMQAVVHEDTIPVQKFHRPEEVVASKGGLMFPAAEQMEEMHHEAKKEDNTKKFYMKEVTKSRDKPLFNEKKEDKIETIQLLDHGENARLEAKRAEEVRKEEERKAEERRRSEERKRSQERKRSEERKTKEERRLEERKLEELKRQEEEKRRYEEMRRMEEEKRQEEERRRQEVEKASGYTGVEDVKPEEMKSLDKAQAHGLVIGNPIRSEGAKRNSKINLSLKPLGKEITIPVKTGITSPRGFQPIPFKPPGDEGSKKNLKIGLVGKKKEEDWNIDKKNVDAGGDEEWRLDSKTPNAKGKAAAAGKDDRQGRERKGKDSDENSWD